MAYKYKVDYIKVPCLYSFPSFSRQPFDKNKGERRESVLQSPSHQSTSLVAQLKKMASDPKIHVYEEVAKHNKTKDCWLVISGKVYDVTSFMEDHPGGDEVLLSATGKDATNDFEDVGHSDTARELMSKYYIGEIDPSSVPAKRAYIPPQQAVYNHDKTPEFVIKILQFLVPILILGLAFAVRSYTKKE